jgi:ribonuclease P protein component
MGFYRARRFADEADLSAQPPQAQADAWLLGSNEDEGRPKGPEASEGQREKAACGPMREHARGLGTPPEERLRRRAEFQAVFQGGKRVERSSVLLLWRPADGPSKAGFTVSRQIRGAVSRNRARRRLREAYRANRDLLASRIRVVFVARGEALTIPFVQLCRDVRDGLESITHQCRVQAGR